MLFRIPSGRLPRCARNDKVLRAEGNHIKKNAQDTLRQFKREPIKISIQFVCKLQSIFFIYQSQPLFISISYSLVFIFIKTHLLYMIARVSFWQFDKKHHFKRGFWLTNRKIRICRSIALFHDSVRRVVQIKHWNNYSGGLT